jgi:quercetin dioxygenase-like cupin family protein
MLSNKRADFGGLKAIIFDFEFKGDILPMHVHDQSSIHITVVARGSIKAYSHDWQKEASAGAVLNFREGEPHEIVALEDGTRIVNILRNTFEEQ